MSIKLGHITWISHRGLCQDADENSLAAFRAAEKAGFHYLETDLRAAKDRHIVSVVLSRSRQYRIPELHICQQCFDDVFLGASLSMVDASVTMRVIISKKGLTING